MGSHHGHGSGSDDFRIGRRALTWLLVVLVPMLVATLVGLVMLWPTGTPPVAESVAALGEVSEDVYSATVTKTAAFECEGSSSDRLPDGSIPATALCASVDARIDAGPDEGQTVTVQIPPQVYRAGISPGDGVRVARYPGDLVDESADAATVNPEALEDGTVYAWVDFSRSFPLVLLAVAFAVLVVAVGRLRGLAAILGLALSYVTVVKFMLPALRLGENPVAVAMVGSIAVMTVVLYLAHGVSAKTTTALLGTIFGLALMAGLAQWASDIGHLNGLSSEENYTLAQLTGITNLSGVILCGIIVAGLGVLNDVTITQASAVWEVRAHAPELGFRELFVSGMRVGRDHLASTVYTIAFAYAGVAMPTLILIDLYHQPLGQVLTGGQLAEEIVRTLVGAIGLILSIPVTTAVAAVIVASSREPAGVLGGAERGGAELGGAELGGAERAERGEQDGDRAGSGSRAGYGDAAGYAGGVGYSDGVDYADPAGHPELAGNPELAGDLKPVGYRGAAGGPEPVGYRGAAGGPEPVGYRGAAGGPEPVGYRDPAGGPESVGYRGAAGGPQPVGYRGAAGGPEPVGYRDPAGYPDRSGYADPAGYVDADQAGPAGYTGPVGYRNPSSPRDDVQPDEHPSQRSGPSTGSVGETRRQRRRREASGQE
ncbi:hypothetical protein Kisp01_44080 [Kineosporia sp. NBRC 101677]|uniref:YibE/F family protein n=1 Tax=Kineosporia sp. NBRC 101677 TaxID=3032197 RepID=UPI0024A3154D|nr:YibE/F family protein [Kineosporia sp. NBRC 101677]GLY17394.1 hypothetical protein Kisp01_44080 [Kineosporia sp. NBRC 101677]